MSDVNDDLKDILQIIAEPINTAMQPDARDLQRDQHKKDMQMFNEKVQAEKDLAELNAHYKSVENQKLANLENKRNTINQLWNTVNQKDLILKGYEEKMRSEFGAGKDVWDYNAVDFSKLTGIYQNASNAAESELDSTISELGSIIQNLQMEENEYNLALADISTAKNEVNQIIKSGRFTATKDDLTSDGYRDSLDDFMLEGTFEYVYDENSKYKDPTLQGAALNAPSNLKPKSEWVINDIKGTDELTALLADDTFKKSPAYEKLKNSKAYLHGFNQHRKETALATELLEIENKLRESNTNIELANFEIAKGHQDSATNIINNNNSIIDSNQNDLGKMIYTDLGIVYDNRVNNPSEWGLAGLDTDGQSLFAQVRTDWQINLEDGFPHISDIIWSSVLDLQVDPQNIDYQAMVGISESAMGAYEQLIMMDQQVAAALAANQANPMDDADFQQTYETIQATVREFAAIGVLGKAGQDPLGQVIIDPNKIKNNYLMLAFQKQEDKNNILLSKNNTQNAVEIEKDAASQNLNNLLTMSQQTGPAAVNSLVESINAGILVNQTNLKGSDVQSITSNGQGTLTVTIGGKSFDVDEDTFTKQLSNITQIGVGSDDRTLTTVNKTPLLTDESGNKYRDVEVSNTNTTKFAKFTESAVADGWGTASDSWFGKSAPIFKQVNGKYFVDIKNRGGILGIIPGLGDIAAPDWNDMPVRMDEHNRPYFQQGHEFFADGTVGGVNQKIYLDDEWKRKNFESRAAYMHSILSYW